MNKIKQWLKDHKPVFNKTMADEVSRGIRINIKAINLCEDRHKKELEEANKAADIIVNRLSDIQFHKGYNDREYTVCCNFSTEMMIVANHDPRALEYIAARTAHEIEHYIKTAKFMHLRSFQYEEQP